MSASRFLRPRALVTLIAGYLVWSSCFVALYGLLSLGCRLPAGLRVGPLGVDLVAAGLVAVWLLHLAALAVLIRATRRRSAESDEGLFMRRLALILHLSAVAATLWIGFPLLLLPPCI